MSFAVDLSRLVEKTKGKTDVAVRKVMLELFSRVVMKSPVDTGRFRANWGIGYASFDKSVSDATDKGGSATIGKIAAEVSALPVGQKSIYLTNSLPYSVRLERGYSKQAPAGMVRLSLVEISSHYGR